MGLAVGVGVLKDLKENDLEWWRDELREISALITQRGLGIYVEPEDGPWETVDFEMIGYSGLHYLRRIAAHLAFGYPLPSPLAAGEDPLDDSLVDRYYRHSTNRRPSMFSRRKIVRPFDHLMIHSDSEGYYIPVDFPDVLFATGGDTAPGGGMVGSSVRLATELEQLRNPRYTAGDRPRIRRAVERRRRAGERLGRMAAVRR